MWTIFLLELSQGCNYSVRKLCIMIKIIVWLVACVSESVPIHNTPVCCGIHLHQSSMTAIIAVHVGYAAKINLSSWGIWLAQKKFQAQFIQFLGTMPLPRNWNDSDASPIRQNGLHQGSTVWKQCIRSSPWCWKGQVDVTTSTWTCQMDVWGRKAEPDFCRFVRSSQI